MSVCIAAFSGALDRDFVVTVSTTDNTAIIDGKYQLYLKTMYSLTVNQYLTEFTNHSHIIEDYTLTTPLSLTISGLATGEESCFSIEVIDDNLFEDREDFTVHLSTDDASVTLHTIYATVTITDNDGMFQMYIYVVLYY